MRELVPTTADDGPRRREPELPVHALLALQRTAGNQAVARHLARRTAPPSPELDRFDVEIASVAELKAMLADASPAERVRVRAKLHQRSMEALADTRLMLFLQLQAAPTDAERRTRTIALRTHDAPYLADIRAHAASPQTRFQHPDPVVQDATLAAIQLEAVADAEGDLASPKDAHKKAYDAAGMAPEHQWCGFFALEKYLTSNFDKDLRQGLFHTNDIERFFTYRYVFGKDSRSFKWIYADGEWQDVRAYHAKRGSQRQWIASDQINGRASLDIRPGDVITVDHSGTAEADHIMMVHSYEARTNTLFTIGGNDGGYLVDQGTGKRAPDAKRDRLEDASGQRLKDGGGAGGNVAMNSYDLDDQGKIRLRVAGIGRMSISDFEDHKYDATDPKKPPAAS